MSLLEGIVDSRTNPLAVVEDIASDNNWAFERSGEDEVTIVTKGQWTDYQLSFTWMGEIEALHLACAFDMKIPPARRAEVRKQVEAADLQTVGLHWLLAQTEGFNEESFEIVHYGIAPREEPTAYSAGEPHLLCVGRLIPIDKPDDAKVSLHREWLLLELRSDWQPAERKFPAGSLLYAPELGDRLVTGDVQSRNSIVPGLIGAAQPLAPFTFTLRR